MFYPQSVNPIPKDILKTNVIRFQICLKSFLFKSQLEVYGVRHKRLITAVFGRGTEQLRQVGRHLALRWQWPDDRCVEVE